MIRHVSVFFFKEGVTEEEKKDVERTLVELEKRLTGIVDYHVGVHCLPQPVHKADDTPMFGELVQIIDFENRDVAERYPQNEAHMKMLAATCSYIEKVVAIDFEL